MLDKITRTIDRYRMLEGARRIGVAVSGGADSVCLLHALAALVPRYEIELTAVHLDHGLRADSAADCEFVRQLADRFGAGFEVRRLELSTTPGNLEQNGRRARLEFFRELIDTRKVDRIATGHTMSDQAETVLFRLLRGAAGAGLSGIHPITSSGLIRPLIAVARAEVLEYLRAHDLLWRDDPTNASPEFARNRIRHQLLPQLAGEWNPAIVATLAQTADWAFEEELVLRLETDRLAAGRLIEDRGAVQLRAADLMELPRAAARRLVRRAVERVKGDLRALSFQHVESVLELAHKPEGGAAQLPGVSVCRSFDWVRFALPVAGTPWRTRLPIPGSTPVPGSNLSLCLEIVEKPETSPPSHYVYNSDVGNLDGERLTGPLTFRNWQPGDRYQPKGSPDEVKLKDLFQRARVPIWERAVWPVLEAGEKIVWSRRFGVAEWCAAGPNSPVVLQVKEVAG